MKAKRRVNTARYIRSLPKKLILPKTSREQAIKYNNQNNEEDTMINDCDNEPKAEIVHITPLIQKKYFTPIKDKVQNKIILQSQEIDYYNTYFYCKECLQVLSGTNKFISKLNSYFKFQDNEDFKQFNYFIEPKRDNLDALKCLCCNTLIGIKNNLIKYYLKDNTVIKNTKVIQIGLFGIKLNILDAVSKQFSLLCNYSPLVTIKNYQQTKDTLFNFNSSICSAYKDINVMFIVHKIEGRLLLLGKNGFYNLLIKEMKQFVNKHIYFILVFKDYSMFEEEEFIKTSHYINSNNHHETISNKIIDDLTKKGNQEELIEYYTTGRIIILNEMDLDQEMSKYKIPLIKEFQNKNCILPKDGKTIGKKNKGDEDKIEKLIKNIKDDETTIYFGESCFIL